MTFGNLIRVESLLSFLTGMRKSSVPYLKRSAMLPARKANIDIYLLRLEHRTPHQMPAMGVLLIQLHRLSLDMFACRQHTFRFTVPLCACAFPRPKAFGEHRTIASIFFDHRFTPSCADRDMKGTCSMPVSLVILITDIVRALP